MDNKIRDKINMLIMIEYGDRTEFLVVKRDNMSIDDIYRLVGNIVTIGNIVVLGYGEN